MRNASRVQMKLWIASITMGKQSTKGLFIIHYCNDSTLERGKMISYDCYENCEIDPLKRDIYSICRTMHIPLGEGADPLSHFFSQQTFYLKFISRKLNYENVAPTHPYHFFGAYEK